jgi:hypothetical protein
MLPTRGLTFFALAIILAVTTAIAASDGRTVEIAASPGAQDAPAGCFDPIPNPLTAGWTREGNEPFVITPPTLRINDTSNVGFVNFYCHYDEAAYASEIRLHVRLAYGWIPAETGLHVTINDGNRQVRAVLLSSISGLAVALQNPYPDYYPRVFYLPHHGAEFVLRRLADGSAILEVPGQGEDYLPPLATPASHRYGEKTLEFGVPRYNAAVSTTEWLTLGLPNVPYTSTALPPADPDTMRFKPAATVPAGLTPVAIETGDLNADGAVDMVVANLNGNGISVMLGDGAGGFLPPASYPVGHEPRDVGIGDLNGDGIPDVVVAGGNDSDRIYVLLGTGGGALGPPASVVVGRAPMRLALADLNGDGALDVVIPGLSLTALTILPGDGQGSFGDIRTVEVGSQPTAAIAADWNGDGHLDLASANWAGDTVSVVAGDGSGAFSTPLNSALLPTVPRLVAAGDLNGDGRIDLVAGLHHTRLLSVLLNDGAGGFRAPAHYEVGAIPIAVAIDDFGGDGSLDVAVAHGSDEQSRVSVFLGDGTGELIAVARYPVARAPYDLAAADFDGDGRTDIAVVNAEYSIAEVLLTRDNRPPVANAGADQTMHCVPEGGGRVALDGTASTDPDGDTLTYRWTGPFPEGGGTVTGPRPTVTLPFGASTIALVVSDGRVDSTPDTMSITVTVRSEGLDAPMAALVPEGQTPPLPKKAAGIGRSLPLKLRLYCGARALGDQDVQPPRLVSASRDGVELPLAALNLTPRQAFRYDLLTQWWVMEIVTRGWKPGTYTVVIEMPDGRRFAAAQVLN